MSTGGLVAITGMHRSGTSLATRIVQIVGLSLGGEDGIAPPGRDNPAGYWENRYVTELNDEILAALGGSWDHPPVLPPGWEQDPNLDPYRERLNDLIARYFGPAQAEGRVVGCKDPRLSILLPLWRTVVDISTTIVLVRSPLEVAASLAHRNTMGASQAALLWMRYMITATRNDPGHLLLTQDAFFEDLRGTLDRITTHLTLPPADTNTEAEARAHLDPGLRHHAGPSSTADSNPLTEMALALWADGTLDLELLPRPVIEAIAQGWLRPPVDTEALTTARAKVVELQEALRKRNRQLRALTPSPSQPTVP